MPTFIVDLRPIGLNYRGFTTAVDQRDAVHHSIAKYFDEDANIGLFIWKQKRRWGESGWNQKIEEMTDEVIQEGPIKEPQEELGEMEEFDRQLKLFEFEQYVNKKHPGTDIAHSWKLYHKMAFMDFDSLAGLIAEKEATFSVKYDGELCAVYYDGNQVELVTIRGTIRTNMPPTNEAEQLLSKHKSGVFLGELYAVDEGGKPMSYMKSASILKNPKGGGDHLLRLSIFDLYALDGIEYESLGINEKMEKINDIFKDGKTVHPALTVRGTIEKADELWSQLETKGWEGLVVHFGADIYKVKPIQSYDMVVVGINKSKFVEQISAVLCAFVDKEGRFRLSGAIGGGFNDEERIRIKEWAERNKVMEDGERIWVDPFKEPLIVEIEAIETNTKNRPTFEFKNKKWVKVENMLSGTLRFPQFVRERQDKEPTYEDVPVEQVTRGASALVPGKIVRTATGAIGTIMALTPTNRQSEPNFNVLIQWESSIPHTIEATEVHPSEIMEIL